MKKYIFLFLLVTVIFLALAAAVSADQDGNANWCNMDEYGCYNTEADGSKSYIYFWSEEARAYFMGDSTAPYTNVVDYCYNCRNSKMGMGGGTVGDRVRRLLSGKWWKSSGTDSHGRYSGDTWNGFNDDGSLEIKENWNYDDGGHLEVNVIVTGYKDSNGEAWAEGYETYTDKDGNSTTKHY